AGTLSYALADGAIGSALITLTAHDNGGTANGGVDTSAPQQFSITAANQSPIAANDSATTSPATPVTIPVLANDSDPDGDPLTVTSVSTERATTDGTTVRYTPSSEFTGLDTFTY